MAWMLFVWCSRLGSPCETARLRHEYMGTRQPYVFRQGAGTNVCLTSEPSSKPEFARPRPQLASESPDRCEAGMSRVSRKNRTSP